MVFMSGRFMAFVSYAQNLEDVMLWRALGNIPCGFYVDVGANDPVVDSVTRGFYERGWRGINIEPLPIHYSDLCRERTRDINLQCAAGAERGEVEIWECEVRGWATASADVVARHIAEGHVGVFLKVPVFQLREILEKHAADEIHFLKIDVEGFEKSVIDGMDFCRFRPWILVIEATRPNSKEEVHHEWEADLTKANYHLAYADGLNRFYVAEEHLELLEAFRYPPNVFDSFVRSAEINQQLAIQQAEIRFQEAASRAMSFEQREAEALEKFQLALEVSRAAQHTAQQADSRAEAHQQHVKALQIQLQQLQVKVDELEASHQRWRQQASALDFRSNTLQQSASWRIPPRQLAADLATHPLRTLRAAFSVVVQRAICITERPLSRLMAAVLRRPQLSQRINSWLMRYPALHQQLIGVAHRGGMVTEASAYTATGYSKNFRNKSTNRTEKKIESSKNFYLESADSSEFKQIDAETALKAIRLELKKFRGEA